MNYLLLLGIVLFIALGSVFGKLHNRKTDEKGIYAFTALTCLFAMCAFILIGGSTLSFTPEIILYAVGFALTYGMSMICNVLAIRWGSMSLTSLFTSYSLLIPTFFGILFWGETIGKCFFYGVILLCVALFMIHFKKGDIAVSLKWFIYVFLAFLGNGLCSTVQRMQQTAFDFTYSVEFMIVALAIVTIFLSIIAVWYAPHESMETVKKTWYYAFGKGATNGLMNYFVMLLNKKMAASIMFPVISAGSIIAVFLISWIFFKERLSKMQILGSAIGIVSIICFNI